MEISMTTTNGYYSESVHGHHEVFELGDFPLEMGETLRGAKLLYKTHGKLNDKKDNVILFPHMWSGTSSSMEGFIGKGRALDPDKYFIILPGMFGNGFSSSPSNTPTPHDRGAFPDVTIGDDVVAQHRLLTERFGIKALELVLGWSMGAQQTYEWAVRYPDMVKRAAPFAGTAKNTPHNSLWVTSHEDALKSDPNYNNGFYSNASDCHVGLRRHSRLWGVMGLCQEFYYKETWRSLGFSSLTDFQTGFWDNYFLPMDPNNLICMSQKWRRGDVSLHTEGNLEKALASIKAITYVITFTNDMFFPPEHSKREQLMIPNSEFHQVDTLWAHFGMFCCAGENTQIDSILFNLLKTSVS
jgi:homoserine O-acetyltransferase/O-succinyltransferase